MSKSLTPEEHQEFVKLKHIRCERGFFIPNEQERFNILFNKVAKRFATGMKQIENIERLEIMN